MPEIDLRVMESVSDNFVCDLSGTITLSCGAATAFRAFDW
jgi:hypothetical protein